MQVAERLRPCAPPMKYAETLRRCVPAIMKIADNRWLCAPAERRRQIFQPLRAVDVPGEEKMAAGDIRASAFLPCEHVRGCRPCSRGVTCS